MTCLLDFAYGMQHKMCDNHPQIHWNIEKKFLQYAKMSIVINHVNSYL